MRRIDRGASSWLVAGFYQLRFLIAATDRCLPSTKRPETKVAGRDRLECESKPDEADRIILVRVRIAGGGSGEGLRQP